MWHILGQTIKSDDSIIDENDSFKLNEKSYEQQQLLDKMNRIHQHHKQHQEHQIKQKPTVNCPKCQSRPELRMTEEELTKLRIEYVKNQILQKLRMTERPNVSATNLPRPIAEGSMIFPDDEEEQQNHAREQFYGKTTQKIIFLELGECNIGQDINLNYAMT